MVNKKALEAKFAVALRDFRSLVEGLQAGGHLPMGEIRVQRFGPFGEPVLSVTFVCVYAPMFNARVVNSAASASDMRVTEATQSMLSDLGRKIVRDLLSAWRENIGWDDERDETSNWSLSNVPVSVMLFKQQMQHERDRNNRFKAAGR